MVRGAALVAIGSVVMAGCSADHPTRDLQAAALSAAVLSLRDMPRGFLPAQDQRVFGGLAPQDPDCRRLLALADLDDLRDRLLQGSPVPPQAHAVFYRAEPGSTMAEHLITLSPDEARGRVEDVRRAAAGCPRIELAGPDPVRRLARQPRHDRRREHALGSQPGPGHRRTPWYRYRNGRDGRTADRPGGRRGRGHGHEQYERDDNGRDGYAQDGYGTNAGGRHEHGTAPRRSKRSRSLADEPGLGEPGLGGPGAGEPGAGGAGADGSDTGGSGTGGSSAGGSGTGGSGHGRSGPAESKTGRGEYGSVPGESGHGPHGHARFGLGFGPGSGLLTGPVAAPGYGRRAQRPGLLLHRLPMALPGLGGDVYGFRYSGLVGRRYQVHFDLVVAELGGRLLMMEQPVMIDRGHPGGDSILRIVKAALRKLRDTTP